MQYFTEQAGSHREVLEKIKVKYGEHAKILTHRTVPLGGFLGLFRREGIEVTGYISQEAGKRKRLDVEEEKKKILSNVKNEQTLQQVLKEVMSLKEQIASRPAAQSPPAAEQKQHPSIDKVEELLAANDFSADFIRGISERLKREFSLEELEDYPLVQHTVVEWIGERIHIFPKREAAKPRIFVIVGPTGVGKTTTIAKLAAIHGVGNPDGRQEQVRMITIDNYRIAAKEQIETYGEIMGIPVTCVENYEDLRKTIALHQEADLILVDTIGKSPRDFKRLAQMRELLGAFGSQAEVHLAVSAGTKTSDVKEIIQQFEPFNYHSIILTKLDETTRIGNIISILSEKRKPVSYITDGQVVPQDIERASVVRLLMHLEGFRIHRERLERKFGALQPSHQIWR